MSKGLDRILHGAVRTLVCRNATLHQRLYEASKKFSAALERREQWPPDLLREAERIEAKLTAKGKMVDTICAMDMPVAAEVAEEIVQLATEVYADSSRRLDTRGHRTIPRSQARAAAGILR